MNVFKFMPVKNSSLTAWSGRQNIAAGLKNCWSAYCVWSRDSFYPVKWGIHHFPAHFTTMTEPYRCIKLPWRGLQFCSYWRYSFKLEATNFWHKSNIRFRNWLFLTWETVKTHVMKWHTLSTGLLNSWHRQDSLTPPRVHCRILGWDPWDLELNLQNLLGP